MSKRSREKLIVDRPVQGTLIARMLLHWLAFVVFAFLLAFAMAWLSRPAQSVSTLTVLVWDTYGPFFLLMVVLLPGFMLDTIKLSHRFAGPIVRFRRAIEQVSQGEPVEKITLRARDFWVDMAEGFNTVVDRIESLEAKSAEDSHKLARSAEGFDRNGTSSREPSARR
jgi:hypothetical protein